MNKLKIFISSVQAEFAIERQILHTYLNTDVLLGRFFDAFIFEQLPATNISASKAYPDKVKKSDIYLGIFGMDYGHEDKKGISPTEREFDIATSENKIRLIFISSHEDSERSPKEHDLIKKAEDAVVRKRFNDAGDLKASVYAALIQVLEDKELIRFDPFDATVCKDATIDDIDPERIKWFIRTARSKRGFPLPPEAGIDEVLTHLNLTKNEKPVNAAILLFGRQPQRFFITSELRCALFHGNEIMKPIPSYQAYKGDLFSLIDQAVDFVLSRIDLYVGDRSRSVDVPVHYELPPSAVTEAIVNGVAHRDYTSNGSVQVMLFRNRLEVWNPGQLPFHLSIAKLKKPHGSFPANPLIAESLYLAGYIERMGTGIPDMIKSCLNEGLSEPELVQEESFKTLLWRKVKAIGDVGGEETEQATEQPTEQVCKLVIIMESIPTSLADLMEMLSLKHRPSFLYSYLHPALNRQWIEMTNPENPNSPNQKYRLTDKGKDLQQKLKREKSGT
jgi:ATP-dependent DNA helicase RecG